MRESPAQCGRVGSFAGRMIVALRLGLGITMFLSPPIAIRCSGGQVMYEFGDHRLSCGQGSPMIPYVTLFSTLYLSTTPTLDVNNNVLLTIAADQEIFITSISLYGVLSH